MQFLPPDEKTPRQTQKPNFVTNPTNFLHPVTQKLEQSLLSVISGKPQPPKSALQKRQQPPQQVTATKSSPKTKVKTRPYTAPAIEIRVALAQNVNTLALACSTSANIIDAIPQHRLKH